MEIAHAAGQTRSVKRTRPHLALMPSRKRDPLVTIRSSQCGTVQGMIVGCGVDMIEISRVAQAIARYGDRFCQRIYLPEEIRYCRRKRNPAESFAARFAAKEAAAKALGTGIQAGVGWRDIEIVRAPNGKPSITFHGRAAEIFQRLGAAHAVVSLTHTKKHALAQVLIET